MTAKPDHPDESLPALAPAEPYVHSDIFDRLSANHDLTGLVAYGLYQQRKRQWMGDLNRVPTEEERKQFAFAYREDAVAALKAEAEGQLAQFAEALMEDQISEMMHEAYNARAIQELERLKASIRKISGYKHHIVGHVIGFVVLLCIVFLGTVLIRYEPHLSAWFDLDKPEREVLPSPISPPGH